MQQHVSDICHRVLEQTSLVILVPAKASLGGARGRGELGAIIKISDRRVIALVRAAKFAERRIAAWITVLTTTSVVTIRTASANTASTGFAGNAASSAVERVIAQIDATAPAPCKSRWA